MKDELRIIDNGFGPMIVSGNLTRRTTSRRRQDGTLAPGMSERRMVWDAENRLRGLSDGGYASLYWYDSDGNRTVKRHGGGEMLYVNSQLRTQRADSAAYSLYPNGWYGIDNFSRFSRHIFIGGERIASVSGIHSGGLAGYDNGDIQTAGTNVSVTVNYDSLLAVQSSLITLYSDSLHAPFSGSPEAVRSVRYLGITGGLGMPGGDLEDNNHTDNSGRADNDRTNTNDSVYYYHRDHLGSTMSVTDCNARAVQTVEYTPWGEVFLEKRNGSFFYSPYLYNGKELDEETGLYYYGARYYDPKISLWYSVDRLAEKYPFFTPYHYCSNNPQKFIDAIGDSVRAVSPISGFRLVNEIHNSFYGSRFDKLNSLFQLSSDRLTMQGIGKKQFNLAIIGLNSDEKALAKGYYNVINSKDIHYVDMTMRHEHLSQKTREIFKSKGWQKGSDMDILVGGGVNLPISNNATITIVVMNSIANVDYVFGANGNHYYRLSTPAELLAHELIGHGYSRSINSINSRHINSIQLSNLYWRVRGYTNFYRDGIDHGNRTPISKTTATGVPSFLK